MTVFTKIVRPVTAVVLLAAASAAPADEADEARETFASLFAKDLETVQATGTRTDDVALAERMVETAGKSTGAPAFLSLLCEHARRLASGHPSGYATAVRAMELVARHVPEKAGEARARLLDLRRKQFETSRGEARGAAGEALLDALLGRIRKKEDAGDLAAAAALYREARSVAKAVGSDRLPQIEAEAEVLARRIRLARRIADVKALLAKNPDNVGAREGLVRLYLVNRNDPAKAAEVLEGIKDEDLKKYVPAAAKPVDEAPELACLELGEWYKGLAETAPKYVKANMYARAKAYLARFLRLHETKDLHRVRGKVAMGKVEAALAGLEAPATAAAQPASPAETAAVPKSATIPPGRWVDLLGAVDPDRDAVKGEWRREDGGLVMTGPGGTRLALPAGIRGDYQVRVEFVQRRGDNEVAFILPVGDRATALCIGKELRNRSGLFWAKDGATMVSPAPLSRGEPHTLEVTARTRAGTTRLDVDLDGEPYFQWEGPHKSLSVWGAYRLPEANRIGLGAWGGEVLFTSGKVRMLSGEARLLRPGG